MILTGDNCTTLEKTLSLPTLLTKNYAWIDLTSNPGFCSDRLTKAT